MKVKYIPPPHYQKKLGFQNKSLKFFVSDIQGRLVVSFALSGSQGQQVWDTRQVERGVYVYTLKAGAVSKQDKLVIQ